MESTVIAIDVANNFFSILLALFTMLAGLVGMIFWFARLENKSNNNAKAISALEIASDKSLTEHKAEVNARDKVMWEKIDALQTGMNQTLVMLGELKGKMNH